MAQPISSLADWSRIRAVAAMTTMTPLLATEVVNVYQTFVRNNHVCMSCPSDLWRALVGVKELYKTHEAEWNLKEQEAIKEQERKDLEGWINEGSYEL